MGRFWFDTREIDPDQAVFERYPDGSPLGKDMYDYYADILFPLTVRYNAGLIMLANRRVSVKTASDVPAEFHWSRADNFGKGPGLEASSDGNEFYFVAKSEVTLTANPMNSKGDIFKEWQKNGVPIASINGAVTLNTMDNPIAVGGDTYIAVFEEVSEGEVEGEVGRGEGEGEGEGEVEGEGVEGEGEGEGEGERSEGEGEVKARRSEVKVKEKAK